MPLVADRSSGTEDDSSSSFGSHEKMKMGDNDFSWCTVSGVAALHTRHDTRKMQFVRTHIP